MGTGSGVRAHHRVLHRSRDRTKRTRHTEGVVVVLAVHTFHSLFPVIATRKANVRREREASRQFVSIGSFEVVSRFPALGVGVAVPELGAEALVVQAHVVLGVVEAVVTVVGVVNGIDRERQVIVDGLRVARVEVHFAVFARIRTVVDVRGPHTTAEAAVRSEIQRQLKGRVLGGLRNATEVVFVGSRDGSSEIGGGGLTGNTQQGERDSGGNGRLTKGKRHGKTPAIKTSRANCSKNTTQATQHSLRTKGNMALCCEKASRGGHFQPTTRGVERDSVLPGEVRRHKPPHPQPASLTPPPFAASSSLQSPFARPGSHPLVGRRRPSAFLPFCNASNVPIWFFPKKPRKKRWFRVKSSGL